PSTGGSGIRDQKNPGVTGIPLNLPLQLRLALKAVLIQRFPRDCGLVSQADTHLQGFKVETSAGTRLRTYQKSLSGSTQMVAIVKDTPAPETPFDWPSGTSL